MPHADLLPTLRDALGDTYEIERPLGAGGMGTVFLGRDRTLERPVAVKIIAPELAAARAVRDRFLAEARVLARLRHPNIVAIYAAGEAKGLLYFVMECVSGESLRERLDREGRIAPRETARILRELADALAYAHAMGIVHRDIKPENVLLDAETGRAMLTDFGVARALEGGGADERLTGTGFVVGSPRYMSPEQASGERTIDGRSDIYSLGLVGWEMLAGEPVFVAPTAASLIVKQITEAATPVSTRVPDAPPLLARTIDRALQKDPSARWQGAGEMAGALEGVLSGETRLPFADEPAGVTAGGDPSGVHSSGGGAGGGAGDGDGRSSGERPAPPPGGPPRVEDATGASAPRHRRRWIAIAAGALAVIAGAVVVLRGAGGATGGADPRKSFLIAPFENQTGDPSLNWLREGSVNMLSLNLAAWRDLKVTDYDRVLDLLRDADLGDAARIGLEDARALARRAGVGTVVTGQITRGGDSLRVVARAYDVATGARVDEAQAVAHAGADPRLLFDQLSRSLLDIAGAPAMTPELAKTTSSSLEAYRAYLAGVSALNRWKMDSAAAALDHAIRADSTFALAYYKRALVSGWRKIDFDDTSDVGSARLAQRYAGSLPVRERGIIDAYLSMTQGLNAAQRGDTAAARLHLGEAQRRYGDIVARDSADAEAWYGLGDSWFHMPWASIAERGRQLTRSLRAFNRTIALDSTFHLAYPHTLEIYSQAGTQGSRFVLAAPDSVAGFDSLAQLRAVPQERVREARRAASARAVEDARHWIAADPDATEAYASLSEALVAANQPAAAAATLRAAMERPAARAPYFAYRIAALELAAGRPDQARAALLDALARYPADSLRVRGGLKQFPTVFGAAGVGSATGRLREMGAVFRLLERAVPTLPATRPGAPGTRTSDFTRVIEALHRAAAGIDFATVKPTIDSAMRGFEAYGDDPPSDIEQTRNVIAYLAYVLARDTAYLEPLRRWRGGSAMLATADVRALQALERGDTAQAARIAEEFARGDTTVTRAPGSTSWLARYIEAEVLAAIGDARGAVATYEAADPARERYTTFGLPDPRWPLYARSHLARGRLYEQLGEREKAIAAYERFLALWKDADPALQPQLRLAREGIARLRDAAARPAAPAAPSAR